MQTLRIEDVTEFVLDGTHGSPERTESGIPVLSAQNVKNGCLTFETDRFTSEAEYKNFQSRFHLSKGDVLLTIVGTIGRSAVVDDVLPLVFQRSVAVLRPKHGFLDSRFLYHVTKTREFQAQLTKSVNKSSQAGVYLGKLKELFVPILSLPEQQRIAHILDRAEALRAKRLAALAQLDELTEAIFIDMFGDSVTNPKGWSRVKLGEFTATGPQNGLYKPASDYGSGVPILRIDAFYDGHVTKFSTLKRVCISDEELDLYRLSPGDIIINRVNSMEYLGKSAIIPELDEPTVFESNMMRFSVDQSKIEPRYLVQFLQTSFIKGQITNSAKHAVNQSSINQKDVKSFQVNVPPLPLQKELIRRLAVIDKLKTAHKVSLAELDELFASLQYRAFRGEL